MIYNNIRLRKTASVGSLEGLTVREEGLLILSRSLNKKRSKILQNETQRAGN